MAKAKPDAPAEADTSDQLADEVIETSLRVIKKRIADLESGEAFADDPTKEIALLAGKAAPLIAEQRQKAKARHRAIVAITPGVITTWLREQTPEVRARVRRDIDALDGPKRSVLA